MAELKTTQINEVWEDLDNVASEFLLKLNDAAGTQKTIGNVDHFKTYLISKWEWSFLSVTDSPLTEFVQYWEQFLAQMQPQYQMMYIALTTEYSPLENYDKHSTITNESDEYEDTHETDARTDTHTTDARTDQVITPEITNTSVNGVNPYDASDFSNVSKDTNTLASNTVQNAYGQNKLTDAYGNGKVTDTHGGQKTTTTEYTHGNIGVTTNAQMLEGELKIREYNLLQNIYNDFALQYLFLAI